MSNMSHQKLLLLCYVILPFLMALEGVKIGVSKPLGTTTTVAPNVTTTETTISEESETEILVELSTTTTPKAPNTTIKTTTTEPEWPEFPPRKEPTTTTTTKKPLSTTKKSKSTTTRTTTTTEAPDTNNTTEIPLPETSLLSSPPLGRGQEYCFCDLTTKSCDINCCCDPDCSGEAFKVFKCLQEITNDFELHEGRFEDFKFQHGLPSCEVNDGWLCVFRTNIPAVGEKVHPSFADTSHYYKWPNLLKEELETESREFYMYGDALKLINLETKDTRNFDLPSSLKPPHCQTKEPIKYLKSQKRTSLIPKEKDQLEDVQLHLLELQERYKILQKPVLSENIYNSKQLNLYVANITLRWCSEILQKCEKSTETHEEDFANEQLNEIQIHIFHNFTNIHGIMIDLWHKDKLEESSDGTWLSYEVKYWNRTIKDMQNDDEIKAKVKDYHKISSGPLGYILGKPIILGRYVTVNKSLPLTEKNQQINYFAEDNNDINILPVLQKHKGLCKVPHTFEMEQINYGINMAKQCKIRMDNETTTLLTEDPSKINFTSTCLKLQDLIHQQLLGHGLNLPDISSYFVSQLGKPENLSEKWLPLNVFNIDFNQAFGQYMQNSGTFICRNILLSLSYEFHIGYLNGMANQNVIKHASLLMGERHDLEFALEELVEVPLTMTVRFYDVNEKAASASSYLLNYLIMYCISLVIILDA